MITRKITVIVIADDTSKNVTMAVELNSTGQQGNSAIACSIVQYRRAGAQRGDKRHDISDYLGGQCSRRLIPHWGIKDDVARRLHGSRSINLSGRRFVEPDYGSSASGNTRADFLMADIETMWTGRSFRN